MNLFRSEEHARNWDGYEKEMSSSIRPVTEWADIFSNSYFRQRSRSDFVSWTRSEAGIAAFEQFRRRAQS